VQGSEAIKPENYAFEKSGVTHTAVGRVLDVASEGAVHTLVCDNALVALQFLTDHLLRVKLSRESSVSLEFGPMIEPSVVQETSVTVERGTDAITFRTAALLVTVELNPYRLIIADANGVLLTEDAPQGMGWTEQSKVFCVKRSHGENFYGFGEKTGNLNKKGSVQSMWNTDVYAPHNPEINELYQSVPFLIGLRDGLSYGLFLDNIGKTQFHLNESGAYRFAADTGELDYYFVAGPTMKDVVSRYTTLTGRMPLPPKWAIGYHQSRYSYETDTEVRELAQSFRTKQIPCDVIYLDIHYMDEYRVFTWHPTRFPQPEQLMSDLRTQGFRVVPIVDPGVKQDPKYTIYREGLAGDHFCRYLEGQLYTGVVWPQQSAFPDFTQTKTRQWWGEKHEGLVGTGIEGIWNDMNEPAIFNETKTMDLNVIHQNDGNPKTHGEMHNIYGLYMSMATYEGMKQQLDGKRPFVLTRAGYAGIQKYAAVWTGDNRSFWEHLQMSVPMILNMGLSGVAFAGADIGGFAFDADAELTARWTQAGAFLPYFRNHSAIGFVRQEPWAFGEPYETVIKKAIELRYHFLPHLYTLFHETSTTGLPMCRPLVLEYPDDRNTTNLSDQFLFGSSLLVAPILTPDTTHRVVYLPEGTWVDMTTGEMHAGGRHILAQAPLDTVPLFAKAGAIYAGGSIVQHTGEQQEITFHVFKGDGEYTFYEDNGETFDYENGAYNLLTLTQADQCEQLVLAWNFDHEGYTSPLTDTLKFRVHFVDEPTAVENGTFTYDKSHRSLDITAARNKGQVIVKF